MGQFFKLALTSMTITLIVIVSMCAFYIANKNTMEVNLGNDIENFIQVGSSTDMYSGRDNIKDEFSIDINILERLAEYREKFYYVIPPIIRLTEKIIYIYL